jgi:hypothetical protein
LSISFNNKALHLINVNYSQFYNFYAFRPPLAGNGREQGLCNAVMKRAIAASFSRKIAIRHILK